MKPWKYVVVWYDMDEFGSLPSPQHSEVFTTREDAARYAAGHRGARVFGLHLEYTVEARLVEKEEEM